MKSILAKSLVVILLICSISITVYKAFAINEESSQQYFFDNTEMYSSVQFPTMELGRSGNSVFPKSGSRTLVLSSILPSYKVVQHSQARISSLAGVDFPSIAFAGVNNRNESGYQDKPPESKISIQQLNQFAGSISTKIAAFNLHTGSNQLSNSFIADNTIVLSADITEDNKPMLIDGGSDPSEPGVPIGDGVYILLLFAAFFCLTKIISQCFLP